jgi:hypothetical protein
MIVLLSIPERVPSARHLWKHERQSRSMAVFTLQLLQNIFFEVIITRSTSDLGVFYTNHFYTHKLNVYKNDPDGVRTRDLGVPYVSLTPLVYTLYKHHALTN